MKILGFLFTILISSTGAAAMRPSVRAEFIDGKDAVIKDFCRTEDPGLYNECGFNQHTTMVGIYLPLKLGRVVLEHINQAKTGGFYDELSHQDFFHGHFLFTNTADYDSPQDFFAGVSAVLYHSAEYNNRWEKEDSVGTPVLERRQRSFVGYLDGHLQKAVELIEPPFKRGFLNSGTIYDSDIALTHPELSGLDANKQSVKAGSVKVCKEASGKTECRVCAPFGQFHIIKEPQGRFSTASGEKVELYLRCFPLNSAQNN